MILRQTKLEDISRVMEIINQAKCYFKENGIDQWQDGYPNEETVWNLQPIFTQTKLPSKYSQTEGYIPIQWEEKQQTTIRMESAFGEIILP